jgi:hypothetical protein
VAISEMVKGKLALSAYLRGLRPPIATAIFALDDPIPALCEFPALFYLLCKRALKRLKFGRSNRLSKARTLARVDAGRKSAIMAPYQGE